MWAVPRQHSAPGRIPACALLRRPSLAASQLLLSATATDGDGDGEGFAMPGVAKLTKRHVKEGAVKERRALHRREMSRAVGACAPNLGRESTGSIFFLFSAFSFFLGGHTAMYYAVNNPDKTSPQRAWTE